MVKVEISFVDGSARPPLHKGDEFYRQFKSMKGEGFDGREIVFELISDDWAAPPSGIRVVGTLEDGTRIDEYLPCETRRKTR